MIDRKRAPWRSWLLDSLLVFAAAAFLIGPLWRVKYLDNWGSIESIFISDARFIRDHGFQALWQPDWYCGDRVLYIYPPALRYGTALIALYPNMTTARAYHIYTSFFYCAGILGVFLFIRAGMGSRRWAFIGAAAAATLSPAFLFLSEVRNDAMTEHLAPQRLNVLIRYGEGPHISALAFIPIALACAWLGLRRGHPAWLALSAAACAMVVSNNFYGATALAMFFPLLVWALWVTEQDHWIWLRAAAIALLAYGLCAAWFVPSFLRLTLYNLRHVSQPGKPWSMWLLTAVLALTGAVTWRWARGRPERAWPVFAGSAAVVFTLVVLGFYFFDFRVLGEAARLVPELDLCFILVLLLAARRLWDSPRVPRWTFALLAIITLYSARHYMLHAWELYPPGDHTGRVEYQLSQWIHDNAPGQRAAAPGSVRFWYNAWFDNPLIGGGSDQGLLNQYTAAAQYQIRDGGNTALAVDWLKAMGAGLVIVGDQHSQEVYHDFSVPGKFTGVLPVLHDNGRGDIVYAVPRRFPGLARVVETSRLDALPTMPLTGDADILKRYVDLLENGPDVQPEWGRLGTDAMRVRARLAPGQSLIVQETYDPNWSARSGSTALPVRQGILQFIRLDPPPGEYEIELRFHRPVENIVGMVLTGLTLLTILALFGAAWRTRERPA